MKLIYTYTQIPYTITMESVTGEVHQKSQNYTNALYKQWGWKEGPRTMTAN